MCSGPQLCQAEASWARGSFLFTQVAEGLTGKTKEGQILRVREVWADNLDEELNIIRAIVDDYPFVAMDTEFPGVVARPIGNFKNSGDYHYQTMR